MGERSLNIGRKTFLNGAIGFIFGWLSLVLVGLIFGVFGIYFLVSYLTRPVQHLMKFISQGKRWSFVV